MQRFNHKWIKQKILCETWPDSSLQVSIKHFKCTLLDVMVLVRNKGAKELGQTQIMTWPSN